MKDVFRVHSEAVISLIAEPIRLGDGLVAAGLVSSPMLSGLRSKLGVGDYDKASTLVSEVSRVLTAANDPADLHTIMIKFCRVLMKQQLKQLDDRVRMILCELGKAITQAV